MAMRSLRLVLLLLGLTFALPATAQELFGSGSTFIFPIMSKWIDEYEKASGVQIGYQPIGSSAGIEEIRGSVVDFAVFRCPAGQCAASARWTHPVSIGDRRHRAGGEPGRDRPLASFVS